MEIKCPFPGMDPYIERPASWADFHHRFVMLLVHELQPLLKPRYVAVSQERLYVVESERPIYPDAAIVGSGPRSRTRGGGAALLEVDEPEVYEVAAEEIGEPYIEI